MKINKLLTILFLCLLIMTGCKTKKETEKKEQKIIEESLKVENFEVYKDNLERSVINYKVSNNSLEDINIGFVINVYKDEKVIETRTINKRICMNDYEYFSYIVQKSDFTSYNYEIKYLANKPKNTNLYENVKVSYLEEKENITLIFDNNNNRAVNANVLIYLFKDGKIVKMFNITANDLTPSEIKNFIIQYPKDKNGKIKYDKIDVKINEVRY